MPEDHGDNIDFSDHKTVFRYRRTADLLRSLAILKVCSLDRFVDNALPVMRACERVLGQRLFSLVARPTFYAQFVGGDTEQELRLTYKKLSEAGIHLMVCPALEEDQGEGGSEEKYERNMTYIAHIGDMMLRAGEPAPCLQFKVTALLPADLLTGLSSHIGRDIQLGELAHRIGGALASGARLDLTSWLPADLNAQLNRGLGLIARFGRDGERKGLRLLVDAEYTYMNPGISAVALGMMLAFNAERAVVWNTYQCYLKEALRTLRNHMDVVESAGKCFGAKIVRGAYMEKERMLAAKKGYPDPICDTYEDTGRMYDSVAELMVEKVVQMGKRCNVVLGTHNEVSTLRAAARIRTSGLDPGSGEVVFGQIYGMADQISVPLAQAGFTVYKSVPYGPLGEVLPYLSRRAAENRMVMAGARRERELLTQELYRRAAFRKKQ